MELENPEDISPFIRAVMPNHTPTEQREAERNLDRFLAVIDEIHARITRELEAPAEADPHDNVGHDATVNSGVTSQ